MILTELFNLYGRLAGEGEVPSFGFSREGISFAVELDADGTFRGLLDRRRPDAKGKLRATRMVVPKTLEARTSRVVAEFLWGNADYVFGLDIKGKPRKARERFDAFRERFLEVAGEEPTDPALAAVGRFLANWDPDGAATHPLLQGRMDDLATAFLCFSLSGEADMAHERLAARKAWARCLGRAVKGAPRGQCLITGENRHLARTHLPIRGVRGGQPTGTAIVSFNFEAAVSYGKEQSLNAPVGVKAAFAYTTAANHLLSEEKRRLSVGDTTTVFWAERQSPAEDLFSGFFDPPAAPEAGASGLDAVKAQEVYYILRRLRDGLPVEGLIPEEDAGVRFHVLGLAPNAGRCAVRFYEVDTFGALAERVGRHYADLQVARQYPGDPEFPSVRRLVSATASTVTPDEFSPVLAGALMRSILSGLPYPESLLATVIARIRADHAVTYPRAALVRGVLVRNRNLEVPMSLDTEREDVSYLLGRLFAVIERIQEQAVPNANATVRDRFFGAAAANPGRVMPFLVRNAQNHLGKLRRDEETRGRGIWLEKALQGIAGRLSGWPRVLPLEEQGLFILGYYHQRADFFTARKPGSESPQTPPEE